MFFPDQKNIFILWVFKIRLRDYLVLFRNTFEQNEGGDDNLNVVCLYKWQNRGWGRWPSVFCLQFTLSRLSKTVESWKSQSKFRPSLTWTSCRWGFLNIQSTFEPLPSSPLHPSTLPLLFCWPSTDSRLISANGTSHTHSSIPDHINIFSTKYFYIS